MKLPTTIQDNQGRIYGVSANGTVTLLGQQQPLSMTSAELNNLNADKGVATFLAAGSYAFDAYNPVYEGDILWRAKYEKIGDYGVARKAAAPGKPDVLKVNIRILDNTLRADNVKFMNSKGLSFTSRRLAEAGMYEIDIVGGPGGDAQEIYALHPKANEIGNYWSLGKILVASYTPQTHKLVLVPVNGASINVSNVQQKLNEIYNPVCVTWEVTADANFTDNTWDVVNPDNKLQVDESGFWSTETLEMKLLKKHYTEKRSIEEQSIYLFVCAEANKANVTGDMPRGKQFGYVFTVGNTLVGRTIAHEIAHGVFKLKHTFDGRYNFSTTALPANLMNYNDGTQLSKYQWDMLHDPGLAIGIFDKDEDVQNRIVFELDDRFKNPDGQSISFLTPVGSLVSLPKSRLKSVNFEYGSVFKDSDAGVAAQYDMLTGTLHAFTLLKTNNVDIETFQFDAATSKYVSESSEYQDNYAYTGVNGFVFPMPCGSTYWLYKFPKNNLPRFASGNVGNLTFSTVFNENYFLPFSTNFQPMMQGNSVLKQNNGNRIYKDCVWCANENTHNTTKDFCEQPELIYVDKIAQLAVAYPDYHKSFTRSRNQIQEEQTDITSFVVYRAYSHWGDILDARFRSGTLTRLEEKQLFLSEFKSYISSKVAESSTFWERLDPVTAATLIAPFIKDESVEQMRTIPIEKRLLAVKKMVLETNCFEEEEQGVLKVLTSFREPDYRMVVRYLADTIKIKTLYTKFNDFFGDDNFTKIIFALSNLFEAQEYNAGASIAAAARTNPKIVCLDLDLLDNRRTSACEVFENNTVVFRNMQGDMFPAVAYDALIPVYFWSKFDILPQGQGRTYTKGEAIYMPAIMAAMLVHNGNRELFSKQAWLALDGLMLAVGVGQARMAWSAVSWTRKLMLGADIVGSTVGIVTNIASDDYIPADMKKKINIGCMFLQAPEAIRGLAEVFNLVKSTQQEVADFLQADRAAAQRQLSQKGEQGLDEFTKKVGNTPVDELRDAGKTADYSVGLLTEELAIANKGLEAINDGKVYIVIHGEGHTFKVYHNGVELDFSHRSLAKYIQENPAFAGKDLVLVSCSNGTAAQNLANKLGGDRKIYAWDGEVEIFDNGFVRGKGNCRTYQSGNRVSRDPLPQATIPKGSGQQPTLTGNGRTPSVILSNELKDADHIFKTVFGGKKDIASVVKSRVQNLYIFGEKTQLDEILQEIFQEFRRTSGKDNKALTSQLLSFSDALVDDDLLLSLMDAPNLLAGKGILHKVADRSLHPNFLTYERQIPSSFYELGVEIQKRTSAIQDFINNAAERTLLLGNMVDAKGINRAFRENFWAKAIDAGANTREVNQLFARMNNFLSDAQFHNFVNTFILGNADSRKVLSKYPDLVDVWRNLARINVNAEPEFGVMLHWLRIMRRDRAALVKHLEGEAKRVGGIMVNVSGCHLPAAVTHPRPARPVTGTICYKDINFNPPPAEYA